MNVQIMRLHCFQMSSYPSIYFICVSVLFHLLRSEKKKHSSHFDCAIVWANLSRRHSFFISFLNVTSLSLLQSYIVIGHNELTLPFNLICAIFAHLILILATIHRFKVQEFNVNCNKYRMNVQFYLIESALLAITKGIKPFILVVRNLLAHSEMQFKLTHYGKKKN